MNSPIEPAIEQNDPVANDARRRLVSSAPVQITLLALYSLPLLLLMMTPFVSQGYTESSIFVETTYRVVTKYITDLRDAFAVFVIPFVTAMSSGRWDNSTKGGLKPIHTFFIFIGLLTVSILLGAYMHVKQDFMKSMQEVDSETALANVTATLAIVDDYIKEILTYISLFLGVSLWKKS